MGSGSGDAWRTHGGDIKHTTQQHMACELLEYTHAPTPCTRRQATITDLDLRGLRRWLKPDIERAGGGLQQCHNLAHCKSIDNRVVYLRDDLSGTHALCVQKAITSLSVRSIVPLLPVYFVATLNKFTTFNKTP